MIRKQILSAVRAAAIGILSLTAVGVAMPANAQIAVGINFNAFHDRLAARGVWVQDARWGQVWRPSGVSADFRPYYDRGHWVYAGDSGWSWASDDDWGDVVYHYGRWVFEPDAGWVWIPGYVWGPAWVSWRWGGGYAGWMPAPPDYAFLSGAGFSVSFGNWDTNFYGYRGWYGDRVGPDRLWMFVGAGHLGDRDFRPFALGRERIVDAIQRTRDVTEYRVVHGVVVNRSFGVREVTRFGGHPIMAASARSVMHGPVPITGADEGRRIALQERAHQGVSASALGSTSKTHGAMTTHTVSTTHHYSTVHHTTTHYTAVHRTSSSHVLTHSHHTSSSSVNVYHGTTVHHVTTYHSETHHASSSNRSAPTTTHAMSHGGSPAAHGPSGHPASNNNSEKKPH